ncbi:MAG TPA: transposase [Spirochaetales bacterium]|jgi:hypothetical protein|nr:transposase [Spirochaetales bacterium]
MAIPEEIKRHKPTELGACEIRHIGGYYYVYLISSVWDREKKRAKKKTGKCIGKINERDGFIPNEHYLRPKLALKASIKCYGVYELLTQLSPRIVKDLQVAFPDVWREVTVIALLRLGGRFTAKSAKAMFEASYLNDLYPDVAMSQNTVGSFMAKLGERRDEMVDFMRPYVKEGQKLIFDGTNIFTSCSDTYAKRGYNTAANKKRTQVRVLYVFDAESHSPAFYRLLPGNVVDKSSLEITVAESGARDVVVIADKGFYSKANVSFLMKQGLSFILPLQDNTKYLKHSFGEGISRKIFDDVFIYHGRQVWYKKEGLGDEGNHLYIYMDEERRQREETHYLEQVAEAYEGVDKEGFFSESRRGVFAFVSNMDEHPKRIFLDYKGRWDIEQCFDYLKNVVSPSAPYQHSNEKLEAWAFLNHVSLLYFYGLVKALRQKNLDAEYSPQDVIDLCRNIVKVNLDNKQSFISETTQKTKDFLKGLGVDLFRNN